MKKLNKKLAKRTASKSAVSFVIFSKKGNKTLYLKKGKFQDVKVTDARQFKTEVWAVNKLEMVKKQTKRFNSQGLKPQIKKIAA